ncbi:MAG TPA: DNA primase [Candidatus Methanoperedens sp.]|nr:DNA primase [Candidatus Methanoperedens sp.]
MFSEDLLDQVRNANPIQDLVSDYVTLKKSGRNLLGLCPFHGEKTPSFTVNPERGIFHCFGCGEGGNVIGFVMKREGMSFPEAVRFLAARRGIAVPEFSAGRREDPGLKERLLAANAAAAAVFTANLAAPAGRQATAYLERRKITAATREEFGIGWALPGRDSLCRELGRQGFSAPELVQAGLAIQREEGGLLDRFRGRVVFPIHDVAGRLVGFGGRLLADGEPKYLNSPETLLYRKSSVLYGLSRAKEAIRREGAGIVVEGYFDLISAAQAGVRNVVATSGTALTDGHAEAMRRFAERWVVVFDGDAAGIRAAKRSLEVFAAHGLFARGVLLPGGADPDSFIRERGGAAFGELVAKAEDLLDFFLRRTLLEHRVDTIEGKVAAVRETVPLLAKVRDRVAQADYLARAAQRLGVKEDVLWSEVRGAAARAPAAAVAAAETPRPGQAAPAKAEVELIKALLAHPAVAAELRQALNLEELESEDCRSIAGTAFALLDRGAGEGFAGRLEFADERLNRLVTGWLADPGLPAGVKEARRAACDCLERLRERRQRRESLALQERIRIAQEAGEHETERELLALKQSLCVRAPGKA